MKNLFAKFFKPKASLTWKELSQDEIHETMRGGMKDVTNSAEPVVDIWKAIEPLVQNQVVDEYVFENELVEVVYTNNDNTYDHVHLPTPNKLEFIVVVVDRVQKSIFGYYKLNLTTKYSLEN